MAMLWESWMLTRRRMAFWVLIAIIGGGVFLVAADDRDSSATCTSSE